MFQKKVAAALDLGEYSVKYVEVETDTATVRQVWQEEVHPGRVTAKENLSDEQLKPRLSELIASMASRVVVPSCVVTALQGDGTWIQYLDFPKLTPAELKVASQAAACKAIPFALESVILSTIPVPALKGPHRTGALVVAALRQPADRLPHLLASCGLKVHRLEVLPLALVREFARNHPQKTEDSVALVNVGFTRTHVIVVRHGMPYYAREFALGGRHFTYGVQMAHRLQWREAETLRRQSDSTERDASYEPFVQEWLQEVKRSVMHFDERLAMPDQHVSHIEFSGGCAAWSGLRTRLEEHMDLPVQSGGWESIRCVARSHYSEKPGTWKAAVGMALEP